MARVKMIVGMSGTRDGVDWPPRGGELDVPADEAADLVRAGYAVAVESAPESAAVDTKPAKRASAKPEKRG
jgi:hypothetical protein